MNRLKPEKAARIVELSEQGKTLRQIAQLTGHHHATIGKYLRAEKQKAIERMKDGDA